MLFMNDIKKTIIGSAKKVLDIESIEIKNAKNLSMKILLKQLLNLANVVGESS